MVKIENRETRNKLIRPSSKNLHKTNWGVISKETKKTGDKVIEKYFENVNSVRLAKILV